MYKEIDEMNKEELANLIALTKKIGSPKDLKRTSEDLAKRFTSEGLKLELWKWIAGQEYRELPDYKDIETSTIKEIATVWDCEESLSITKTEEKIAEKVLLKVVERLTPDQRENLAKAIEKKRDIPKKDMNEIKRLLLHKGKIANIFPLLIKFSHWIIPLVFYPPHWIIVVWLLQKWITKRQHRKFILGIIVAFCVMKRLEKGK